MSHPSDGPGDNVQSVEFYKESKTQLFKSAATLSPFTPDTSLAASHLSAPIACHCTSYQNVQAKGWDAMERALDGFDKQQVEDYKDDIDTLLVFAGLYSAVLTAFVIESYPLLQEDTAGESLQVLRQIATQSAGYVIMGGQLVNTTATVPSASLSQFEPTSTAVRLNVLWFASLVLSLSTASLGILVKSWLREYVAFATSSAQGNLRVRAFRRSGLETWQVFGIASILPLLLQLSLLFFFVGLCYFTANVHPSVRNTTLPLVCAWGFIIFSAILAPIFSARCPYKTPGLKPLTTAIRVRVYLPITRFSLSRVLIIVAAVVHRHFLTNPTDLNRRDNDDKDKKENLHEDTHSAQHLEEAEIIKDSSKDLDILASADALQANDELLGTTMKAALEQSKPTLEKAVEFLLKVMGNRIPGVPLASESPTLIDVCSLSAHVRQALQDILTLYALNEESRERFKSDARSRALEELSDQMLTYAYQKRLSIDVGSLALELRAPGWAIHLYVSLFQDNGQITHSHRRLFLECAVSEGVAIRRIIRHAQNKKRLKPWMLVLACEACRDSDDADLVNGLVILTKLVRLVGPTSIDSACWTLPEQSVHCLFEQFNRMTTFKASVRLTDSSPNRDGLARAVSLVLELFGAAHSEESSLQWDSEFARLGPKLYTSDSRELLRSFLHGCILQPALYIRRSVEDPRSILWGLTCVHYDAEAIARLEEALDWVSSQLKAVDAAKALALCDIIVRLAIPGRSFVTQKFGITVHPWRPVFNILADLLQKCKGNASGLLSDVCWISIEKIDKAWFQPSSIPDDGPPEDDAWLHHFKESGSAAGDYFCSVLKTFTVYDNGDLAGETWRSRRLSGMTRLAREELERRGKA